MTEKLQNILGEPSGASRQWTLPLPGSGSLTLAEEDGGANLHAIMRVAPVGEIGQLDEFVRIVTELNFMWRGGPFTYAVDSETDEVILQERVPAGDIPDGAALDDYLVRAAQALADARNLVLTYAGRDRENGGVA